MEKDIETHTFHLTNNPQTFKLKNEIKNEKGSKRICAKNIQLEKKFFNIMRETEIEWGVKELSNEPGDDGSINQALVQKYSDLYIGEKYEIEKPSLQLIDVFFGFYFATQNFLRNIQKYTLNWEYNVRRIKVYKAHMLSIISVIKDKFTDFSSFYFGVHYKPLYFNLLSNDTLRQEMEKKLNLLDSGSYEDELFVIQMLDDFFYPRMITEIHVSLIISLSFQTTLAGIIHALNQIFDRLDYANHLKGRPPPTTEEKQLFIWDTTSSTVQSILKGQAKPIFNQLYTKQAFESISISGLTGSITLEPGYYGIDWFDFILNAIPGVSFKVYEKSKSVTLVIFDPYLKLKLNTHVGQLLGLPSVELQNFFIYKGKYDIDSIKYLFIHCEQLDPNYNFYDGKSSTVLSTRDTALCNLEVNPTCKRLVDRNIDELTFSLKNDKGRLVSGEGDGILLEVNIV